MRAIRPWHTTLVAIVGVLGMIFSLAESLSRRPGEIVASTAYDVPMHLLVMATFGAAYVMLLSRLRSGKRTRDVLRAIWQFAPRPAVLISAVLLVYCVIAFITGLRIGHEPPVDPSVHSAVRAYLFAIAATIALAVQRIVTLPPET